MNLNKKSIVIYLCLIFSLLTACSYREFEDSLKQELNNDEDVHVNEAIVPEQPAEDEEDDGLFFIGDTIARGGVEYTLNDVRISKNINEVGLDKVDFFWQDQIEDNGDIESGYKLVTVDVTVKNINYTDYELRTNPDLERDKPNLFIESYIGFKDDLEDPNGPFIIETSYFSEHPPIEQDQWNDYYQFLLDHGEEVDAIVGWIVPIDQLNEESLYYLNGSEGRAEDQQYFYIISEGEIVYRD
ncbi:hypothetical protein KQI76_07480 [Amphibacillus sp. MSJ-3]|uniref:DUF5027 family lipoprotein n=1 Tax=Amphibacillus sp. MSJ-3 TaxID=2841505 RepID=UPI001C0EBADC|nr:hypothetical protein [Amphibacillus sp. MSJ-3]MBU5595004.1 hypothetical protein [Amphibacillus sp. MSJ-3]